MEWPSKLPVFSFLFSLVLTFRPCVMDCKMGLHTYEDDANISKKLFQGTADHLSTTSEMGMRALEE
jgi:hypothetical protein